MEFEVLILGTDANAYYMARCTYEAFHKKAYVIGNRPLAFTKYSNILNVSYDDKMWNEKDFLHLLETFRQNHPNKKILLISTNETYTEFISTNEINEQYIYNIPSIDIIKSLTNKEIFYEKYKNSNLHFPKIYEENDFKKIKYPVVIKPANVVSYNHLNFDGKKKIYKITNKVMLKEEIKRIRDGGYTDKLIIQEFIPGDDSCLFDSVAYVNSLGKVEFLTFAQIGLQERTTSMVGNAAVLINGFNTTNGDTEKMALEIKDFLETIGYRGFAEVDMKYDIRDNTFKVLEINARQGRCSYYVNSLGKNLVKVLIDDCLLNIHHDYEFLNNKVLLSFVPKGIVKRYVENDCFKQEVFKLWKDVIKPMACKEDKNIKRFLMLRKRWLHYYKEYKNSYWR